MHKNGQQAGSEATLASYQFSPDRIVTWLVDALAQLYALQKAHFLISLGYDAPSIGPYE